MKAFKQFIISAFSTKSIGIFVFICTAIALTLILSSRYYLHHTIIENGVSKKDVYANKTIKIIDTEKTQKLKNEIIKKVLPILVPVQDDFIKNNLDKNIDKFALIRNSDKAVEAKQNEMILFLNVSSENTIETDEINHLIKMSDAQFDKIAHLSKTALSNILSKGVSETDIQDNFDALVRGNVPDYTSASDLATVNFLIKNVIAPNIVTDEEATEMSKRNALNSVKPVYVTYKAGSKIVSAGQIVSKLQRDALKQSGYNIIQLNATGIFGIFVLVLLALVASAYYIENYEQQFKRKAHYCLLSMMMLIIAACAAALPPQNFYIFLLPITTFTILISIFLNTRVALVTTLSLLAAVALALQLELLITVTFVFGTFATLYTMASIDYTKGFDLVRVGLITSGIYIICLVGGFFLEYNLDDLNFTSFGGYALALIANGVLSSIFALGLLPIIEAMFKISTPYGLMELANNNHPLLLKLQEKAPGTHYHSQMVAILAEAAADAIGANAMLTRIGALYHDIGKINRPLFFVENQSYYGIDNPHEQFSPKFSKMVITTHPKDGVEIAKEYKISPAIYPFILEHHGDSIASYFYNEAVKQEGAENVTEEEYRYNAPRPSSKESAIVMLADSIESAVRSLKNSTFEEKDAKIHAIINAKLLDGQLSDSPLTLKDLKTIAATFNRVLKGMHHERIKYHEDFENIQEKVGKKEDKSDEN